LPKEVELGRGANLPAAAAVAAQAAAHWWPRFAADAHSRRIVLLRRMLPAIGLGLLLLVGAWPRLEPLLSRVAIALPRVDRRDARELRMIEPRYAGIDRLNRPYVLTAAAGRQMPERGDLVSLDRPRGQLIVRGGAKVVLTAAVGIYQAQMRLLDLFGEVTVTHDNGTRFVTRAAHLDLAAETASGQDPVAGTGPDGSIEAQGFSILDKGDTILFSGVAHLLLRRVSAGRQAPPPPALPARVEQEAARIAAAAPAALAAPQTTAGEPAPTEKPRSAAGAGRQDQEPRHGD
jgi:lipopolysaccharide export system protein LptC